MNVDILNELEYILAERIRESFGLVSARHIEKHVLADPYLFPVLAGLSQKGRRNTISRIMNAGYELWNDPDRPKKRNRVWNLQRKRGSQ
jgi:hypothetical protein